jgi:hypothetical protein
LNWRVALPVVGATAVAVAALLLFLEHPRISSAPQPSVGAAAALKAKRDFDPTLYNYQMVANRSLDQLDDLLTRQGNRNLSPNSTYTASGLAGVNASD